jgi:alpha/beta superfamily hydrolase
MKEQQVTFRSQDLTLEGLYAAQTAGAAPKGAVVCHPHPQYGGSMYNNVVEAALEALWGRGFTTLRFNFRGVGESEGSYGGGEGEAADAAAAVSFLRGQSALQSAPIVLAGYSFGAAAAWGAAPRAGALQALVLIAAPLRMMDTTSVPQVGNILLIGGSQDSFCPGAELEGLCARLGKGASFRVVDGADHFFGGYEDEVSTALGEMLAATGV